MADGAKEFKEITLKFGKGYVKREFQGKDGNQYKEIRIPNQDKNDNRPWQSFVAKANHVHENQFGKGVWMKLPAEGHTTLRRSVATGKNEDGTTKWETQENKISNTELKKLMEGYKERAGEPVAGEKEAGGKKEFKEVTLKFGKGYVKEEFQGRDGNRYKEIMVPNQDNKPWETFVVKANHIHENQFGKGVWMKLPAEGHTTLRHSVAAGRNEDGTTKWETKENKVSNIELKKMMEAYKERPRESVTEKLAAKKAEAASQKPAERMQEKNKAKEAAL